MLLDVARTGVKLIPKGYAAEGVLCLPPEIIGASALPSA